LQGQLLDGLGRHEEALTTFEGLLEADDALPRAVEARGWIAVARQHTRLGRHDAAARAYERALEAQPNDASLKVSYARTLLRLGRAPEVLAVVATFDSFEGDLLRAAAFEQVGAYQNAERLLESLLSDASAELGVAKLTRARVQYANLLSTEGRETEAQTVLERVNDDPPSDLVSLRSVFDAWLTAGVEDGMLPAFEGLDAVWLARDAGLALDLATVHERAGRYASAERLVGAVLARTGVTPAQFERAEAKAGRLAYHAGRYDEARERFERLIDAESGEADLPLWAGLASFQQGAYTAAVSYLELARDVTPSDAFVWRALAAAYVANEQWDAAATAYQQLQSLQALDAESLFSLGWALYETGRTSEASSTWNEACQMGYRQACVDGAQRE
jgi:tetratricopeptide (TPR) repeat protein